MRGCLRGGSLSAMTCGELLLMLVLVLSLKGEEVRLKTSGSDAEIVRVVKKSRARMHDCGEVFTSGL